MFDYLQMLLDGSIDLDENTDGAAGVTSRVTLTGATVVDLGPDGTPAGGLAAVMICPSAAATTDVMTAVLEVSDSVDFTATVNQVGQFVLTAATAGQLAGGETPCAIVLRFSTKRRYVRFNGTVAAGGDDFGAVRVLLSPSAFYIL